MHVIPCAVPLPSHVGSSAYCVNATSWRTWSGPAVAERANLEPQRVEVDEPLGVALAVDGIGLERGEVGPVERARRPPAGHRHAALVELEAHGPGHLLHAVVHETLQRLALRR